MKKKPEDIEDIEKRIEIFSKDIKQRENGLARRTYTGGQVGLKIVIDFVSAVFIGGALGFFLDEILNTKPFVFIFMILCGGGAGFLNIYRFLKKREKEEL